MLAIVPLAGLCVTGTWRGALRLAKDWGRVLLLTFAAAAVIGLAAGLAGITPSP